MNRADIRAQTRATKRRFREQRTLQRKQVKEQVRELRRSPLFVAAAKKKRARRNRRIALVLIAILLLLLLQRCDCEGGPDTTGLTSSEPATVVAPESEPPKRPGRGRLKKSKRPKMNVKAPPPPPWLAQFRMQVAARGPRLATCLNGNESPGAMRLSALVHPRSGRITEAKIEPVFRGTTMATRQLSCLVERLSEQAYKLDDPDPDAIARRVSLIFEF